MAYEKNMNYAGFWKRFAAAVIDIVIWIIPFMWFGNIVAVPMMWIYCVAFESSSRQATPGKMALGIKVTDLNGRRIGFGKATGRSLGKIVSGVIFYIGFIMIAFTEKKQGLHDKMAGCLVVNK